jgi:large subunit ribosomal protein L35
MPKIKTHSSSKKRFSLTGTGKVKRAKAFKRHILTKKTTKRTRNLRKSTIVSDVNAATVKMMIPYK